MPQKFKDQGNTGSLATTDLKHCLNKRVLQHYSLPLAVQIITGLNYTPSCPIHQTVTQHIPCELCL